MAQRRSRSPASRQRREQGVPMRRMKGFEKWPECRTMRPMPSWTRWATRSAVASSTLGVGLVAPPEEDVGVLEARGGEAVLGLVEGGGGGVDAVVGVEGGGDGGVDAVGVDGADEGVLALVDELVPDDGSDHGGPSRGWFGGEWRGWGGGARGCRGGGVLFSMVAGGRWPGGGGER